MKTLILSTALAAGLAAVAIAPAGAAGLAVKAPLATAPLATDVACRMVEKRTTRNGVTRIVKSRECSNDRYERRVERRVYRGDTDRRYVERRRYDDRPGFNIRIGQ